MFPPWLISSHQWDVTEELVEMFTSSSDQPGEASSNPPLCVGGWGVGFIDKVMSLLFNILSKLVITFLPRSKRLLILWLQSPSAVILEPRKIKASPCGGFFVAEHGLWAQLQ